MPWPLNYVQPELWSIGPHGRVPGDWTYGFWILSECPEALGKKYLNLPSRLDKPRRLPIIIRMPDGCEWCPDRMGWNQALGFYGDGWDIDVSGGVDLMTITPSINILGHYHGWVRTGYLTDDIDGRTFPRAMTRVPAAPPLGRIDTPPPGDLTPDKPFRALSDPEAVRRQEETKTTISLPIMTDQEARELQRRDQAAIDGKHLNDALARRLAGLPPPPRPQ